MVDLFGLMISSGHMQEINVGALPGDEGEDAFNRKGSSIDIISIKKILVIDSWESVEFEDVEEVIVLSMDITTDSYMFLLINLIVN